MLNNYLVLIFLTIIKIISKFFTPKLDEMGFLGKLNLLIINSNHPKRIDFYYNFLSEKKIFMRKDIDILNQNNIPSNQITLSNNNFDNKKFFFIGDSHVEFYSRLYFNKYSLYRNRSYALWMGAKTVIGFANAENISQLKKNLKFYNSISNPGDNFIISLGSIDVRCIFYELLFRKIFKNEEEIYKRFNENLKFIFESIRSLVSNDRNLSFLGTLNSSNDGNCPQTINDLDDLKKKDEFVTLGTIKQRSLWTNSINRLIMENCNQFEFKFLNLQNFISQLNINENKIFFDGIHCYSKNFIQKLYYEINRKK
jgi:hypothetical protein